MSENGLVELPVLAWMCGEPGDGYGGKGLGWTYRDEKALAPFGRALEDLLVAAILRINPAVKTNAQAGLAVNTLRLSMVHPDKLTANRQTLDLLRDGAKVALQPGEDTQTVRITPSVSGLPCRAFVPKWSAPSNGFPLMQKNCSSTSKRLI